MPEPGVSIPIDESRIDRRVNIHIRKGTIASNGRPLITPGRHIRIRHFAIAHIPDIQCIFISRKEFEIARRDQGRPRPLLR